MLASEGITLGKHADVWGYIGDLGWADLKGCIIGAIGGVIIGGVGAFPGALSGTIIASVDKIYDDVVNLITN
jgi:hypothetical protein